MVATTNPGPNRQFLTPILCVTVLAATVAGCQQPIASNNASKPDIAVATSDPVMLSSAAFTTGSISPEGGSAVTAATGTAPANSAAVPVPESAPAAMPASQNPPPQTAVTSTPPPPNPPAQPAPSGTASASTPAASAPPAAALQPDGYPNINVAPQEPGGQLLTPEERAKLIAELNALATRNTGGQ